MLTIPFDIWDRIFSRENIKMFDASNLVAIQLICWQAAALIQPYIYRHVNLLDLEAFTSFKGAVKSQLNPGQWVRTLQISFNTQELQNEIFDEMSAMLFALKNLHCLNISYLHHDENFVPHFQVLATSFSSSLKEVHIKPIFEESWRNRPGVVRSVYHMIYSP